MTELYIVCYSNKPNTWVLSDPMTLSQAEAYMEDLSQKGYRVRIHAKHRASLDDVLNG
jgi:hypothetical protein